MKSAFAALVDKDILAFVSVLEHAGHLWLGLDSGWDWDLNGFRMGDWFRDGGRCMRNCAVGG